MGFAPTKRAISDYSYPMTNWDVVLWVWWYARKGTPSQTLARRWWSSWSTIFHLKKVVAEFLKAFKLTHELTCVWSTTVNVECWTETNPYIYCIWQKKCLFVLLRHFNLSIHHLASLNKMFRNAWPRYVLGLSNPLLTTTFYQKFIMTLSFVKLVFILADQSIKSPMRICVLGASMQEKIKQI